MPLEEPLRISKIDLEKIVYTKVKKSNNKNIVIIKYGNSKSNFVFQTPSLNLVSRQDNNIEVSLVGKEKEKVNSFSKFLVNLENKLKNDAQDNYNNWFDNSNPTINFQKLMRVSDQYNTGTLKFKIINSDDFKTIITNNTNNNNVWVKMILELYAIWINPNNTFGVYLRPIMVSFENKNNYNYKFVESDSDSETNVDIPDTEIQQPIKNNDISNNDIFIPNNNTLTDVETLVSHLDLVSSISSLISNNSQDLTSSAELDSE
jgi:hypothetical protein